MLTYTTLHQYNQKLNDIGSNHFPYLNLTYDSNSTPTHTVVVTSTFVLILLCQVIKGLNSMQFKASDSIIS
ncbi:hypothetical protein, partial [uncultured Cytophaga sp.]|uniref:hypothetical protein n=1 Tax=uncultured Cytophaga sp. TaxID=160238 RepID=UPI002614D81D